MNDELTILGVRNPVWANAEHTKINAMVHFKELGEIPYTSTPNRKKKYSAKIWDDINAGLYGDIGEFVPHELSQEELAHLIRKERNYQLFKSDWTQLADIPQETKEKWAPYRRQLRDITNQSSFPYSVVWPNEP